MKLPELPDVDFSSDRPIASHGDDLLRRDGFANAIADAVMGWNEQDSLVMGVYGSWGSGKSSVKNLVLERLHQRERRPHIVEFNPWAWSGQERLLVAFFDEIGTVLQSDDAKENNHGQLAKTWRKYGTRLALGGSVLGHLKRASTVLPIPLLPMLFGGAEELAKKSGELAKAAAEAHEANRAEEPSLEKLKKQLWSELSKIDRPILVVIDDVDRLGDEEIRLLFQLVKINADFPRMIYLLMFDRAVVEAALNDCTSDDGGTFLEKIIQVGIDLPMVPANKIESELTRGLSAILRHPMIAKRFSKERWEDLFHGVYRHFFLTLRDVKRFLSSISFLVRFFVRDEVLEINLVDLIGIEILRVFEPRVFHQVSREPHLFLNNPFLVHDLKLEKEQKKTKFDGIVNLAAEHRRRAVATLLTHLFPRVSEFVGGHSSFSDEANWTANLNVCHPDYFDRYFALDLLEGDIPHGLVESAMSLAGDRDALRIKLEELYEKGVLGSVLSRIDDAGFGRVPDDHKASFITALMDLGDKLPRDHGGFMGFGIDVTVRRIIYQCLQDVSDLEKRSSLLLESIKTSTGINIPCRLVQSEIVRERESRTEDKTFLLAQQFDQAKVDCITKIETAVKDGTMPLRNIDFLLWIWMNFGNVENAKQFATELCRTQEGALSLIQSFDQVSYESMGNRTREKHYILLSRIERFIDVQMLKNVLSPVLTGVGDLESDDLSPYRHAIESFKEALVRRDKGIPESPDGMPPSDDF